jgi:lysophospholipase L1-like esterase
MNFIAVLAAAFTLLASSAVANEKCDVPDSFTTGEIVLDRVAKTVKATHRLDITVIGTGSSTLPGSDGAQFAYPARLQDALTERLPGYKIRVTVHVKSRQTAAEMAAGLNKILADDKPALVIWQAGTSDAVNGVEPEVFAARLREGVEAIVAAGADVDLVNMQYSPRTESMLHIGAYANVMRWVAQEHGALLFDRLGIMRHWTEEGVFDLYASTKKYDMARRVHDCIGRALASQIINAAHLTP